MKHFFLDATYGPEKEGWTKTNLDKRYLKYDEAKRTGKIGVTGEYPLI